MPNYLLLSDPRFRKQALSEVSPSNAIERIETLDKYATSLYSETELPASGSSKPEDRVFVYAFMEITEMDPSSSLENIANAIKGLLSPHKTFRIIYKSYKSEMPRGREMEISIGEMIESKTNPVDLGRPELVVLVIDTSKILISVLSSPEEKYAVIQVFHPPNLKNSIMNRAELKLSEAIDHFGVKLEEINICLDIGAAPGGWTNYMLREGKRVIAIDSASMDYKNLSRYGKIAVFTKGDVAAENSLYAKIDSNIVVYPLEEFKEYKGYSTMQIKDTLNTKTESLLSWAKAEMLLVDCNTTFPEIMDIVILASRQLVLGGVMIFTLKLMSPRSTNQIKKVIEKLGKYYSGIRVKKLIHNRCEVTIFGTRSVN